MKTILLLFFVLSGLLIADEVPSFAAPKHWTSVDPKLLLPSVKISFLKEGEKGFCPSINLAVEKIEIKESAYLKIVKKMHESNPQNRWRSLGKIQTKAGMALLTEVDTKNKMGDVRLLQMILVKKEHVYVITASALKEEFAQYYQDFKTAFESLTLEEENMKNEG